MMEGRIKGWREGRMPRMEKRKNARKGGRKEGRMVKKGKDEG